MLTTYKAHNTPPYKFSNSETSAHRQLASCLINAQPIPAHSTAADDNSLIGCTSHDLTDDWSLPVSISLLVWLRSFIEPDLFDNNVPFNNATQIYLINLPCKLGLELGLDLKLHYFSIFT